MKINHFTLLSLLLFSYFISKGANINKVRPPNILFAISDDQSFAHTSFAGCKFINTPAFDRVAREGVYFANCMAGSPGCAPSRSTIVTGRYHWQNEQSGQHASSWLKKFVPFIDILDKGGYATGRTGKGVDPFQYARDIKDSLWRATNAAGVSHSNLTYDKNGPSEKEGYTTEMSTTDYFGNFKYFIENVKGHKPFFFWYGGKEPHRNFEKGSWRKSEKKLEDVSVPGFLPDNEEVRADLLDYAIEVEWFDLHLKRMLDYLEEIGELENTIVIVTSDNGKAFPRAKANGYEYGIHVPMAIRYPEKYVGGRIIEDPISFVDLAPTILEITNIKADGMLPISGRSFLDLLVSKEQGVVRNVDSYALSGRERHSSSRYNNMGYPQRTIRSKDYLFIWNMRPERWPAGAPQMYSPNDTTFLLPINGVGMDDTYYSMSAFTDVDESPTKQIILENSVDSENQFYYNLSFGKRPEYELYDIRKDPACLNNLVGNSDLSDVESKLKNQLMNILIYTEDPRVVGPDTEIFDSYLRYSPMRKFPQPNN